MICIIIYQSINFSPGSWTTDYMFFIYIYTYYITYVYNSNIKYNKKLEFLKLDKRVHSNSLVNKNDSLG